MTFQPGSPRSPSVSSAVHSSGRRRSRRLTALAGLLTLAAGLLAAAAPAASAAAHAAPAAKATTTDGWIRLAHLSPEHPAGGCVPVVFYRICPPSAGAISPIVSRNGT
jgi:hypothetical protein